MEGPLTPSLFSAVSASKVEGIVCAPEAEDNSSNGSDMLLAVCVGRWNESFAMEKQDLAHKIRLDLS
jgi:hypothetical protein